MSTTTTPRPITPTDVATWAVYYVLSVAFFTGLLGTPGGFSIAGGIVALLIATGAVKFEEF